MTHYTEDKDSPFYIPKFLRQEKTKASHRKKVEDRRREISKASADNRDKPA